MWCLEGNSFVLFFSYYVIIEAIFWKKMCILLGYGVFTTEPICSGDFVMEYAGQLMSVEEADAIADQTYIYYFEIAGLQYR